MIGKIGTEAERIGNRAKTLAALLATLPPADGFEAASEHFGGTEPEAAASAGSALSSVEQANGKASTARDALGKAVEQLRRTAGTFPDIRGPVRDRVAHDPADGTPSARRRPGRTASAARRDAGGRAGVDRHRPAHLERGPGAPCPGEPGSAEQGRAEFTDEHRNRLVGREAGPADRVRAARRREPARARGAGHRPDGPEEACPRGDAAAQGGRPRGGRTTGVQRPGPQAHRRRDRHYRGHQPSRQVERRRETYRLRGPDTAP